MYIYIYIYTNGEPVRRKVFSRLSRGQKKPPLNPSRMQSWQPRSVWVGDSPHSTKIVSLHPGVEIWNPHPGAG